MKLTTTSDFPFEKIVLDIVWPLNPHTYLGNKFILTIQDGWSKFSVAYPLVNQEAETIAETFVKEFIYKFGSPIYLYQGANFQ